MAGAASALAALAFLASLIAHLLGADELALDLAILGLIGLALSLYDLAGRRSS